MGFGLRPRSTLGVGRRLSRNFKVSEFQKSQYYDFGLYIDLYIIQILSDELLKEDINQSDRNLRTSFELL